MRNHKVWIALMLFGILLITTVCYLTLRNNSHKQYADGEIVQITDPAEPSFTWIKMEWK